MCHFAFATMALHDHQYASAIAKFLLAQKTPRTEWRDRTTVHFTICKMTRSGSVRSYSRFNLEPSNGLCCNLVSEIFTRI
jgi:hypothetical protein